MSNRRLKCPECKEGYITAIETFVKTNSSYVNTKGQHYSKTFYNGVLHHDWTQYQCTNESCETHNTDDNMLDCYVHDLQRGNS